MTINKSREIINILKDYIKNPKPELDYNNNFELLIAVTLSAQTKDQRVNIVTKELFKKYPDSYSLMNADISECINIINILGFAKNKAKNIIEIARILSNEYNGNVPDKLENLMKLPGVGRKTALVVQALGFNIPAIPVDTHVIRVSNRLGYVKDENNPLVIEKVLKSKINKEDWILAHHLFLLFGRYHCKAINPLCDNCILNEYCKSKKS